MGIGVLQMMFSHPSSYCVVAEAGGAVIGSNCLDERSSILGIGPVTVDPAVQNAGAGRRLMRAVLDRATERDAPGVRLVQAAFRNRSLSLYTKLGFEVRELLSVMHGAPMRKPIEGCSVRPAKGCRCSSLRPAMRKSAWPYAPWRRTCLSCCRGASAMSAAPATGPFEYENPYAYSNTT